MPAVLAAGLGPVYFGRFWGVIHPMSMPSLATAAGPSYFFRPARSGPLSGQTLFGYLGGELHALFLFHCDKFQVRRQK